MGSDNPKGAVAPARTKATMVKYLGVFAVVLVLTVTLSTSPNTRGGGVRRLAEVVSPTPTSGALERPIGKAFASADETNDRSATAAGGGDDDLGAVYARATGGDDARRLEASSSSASARDEEDASAPAASMTSAGETAAAGVYGLSAMNEHGVDTKLSFLAGHVSIFVNVASQ